MKMFITKRYKFSSAHVLGHPEAKLAENEAIFGKCSRVHGHNYQVEITVGQEPQDREPLMAGDPPIKLTDGMVFNFYALSAIVQPLIIDRWDHRMLNDLEDFADTLTTAENMATVIFDIVQANLPRGLEVQSVQVWETENSSATIAR